MLLGVCDASTDNNATGGGQTDLIYLQGSNVVQVFSSYSGGLKESGGTLPPPPPLGRRTSGSRSPEGRFAGFKGHSKQTKAVTQFTKVRTDSSTWSTFGAKSLMAKDTILGFFHQKCLELVTT